MPPIQLLCYATLAIIALYLAYEVSTSIILLFWFLTKILFYGILLAAIIMFLYKKGFFEFLKK